MNSPKFRVSPLLACASLTALFATGVVQAAALHVSAASASTNMLYDLTFSPAPPASATPLSITPLPPKGGSSVRSLAYVYNEQTRNLDLLAADTTGGRIVRYAAAAGAALPVWAWPVAGPRGTDGLSVDAQGNLYALSSDAARNELWVLLRDPALPPGAGFLAPLLVDNSDFVTTSKTRLLETVVVNNPILGGPGAGDLLVLVNDGRVMRYSAASLRNFLTNAPGGRPIAKPQTLVTAAQFPVGQQPTGMALWPADGSLLVATTGGTVLRFTLTTTGATPMTNFAGSLGGSLGKIKAFVNSNVPYAVVGQPAGNVIFALSAPNATPARITGVTNPIGLATPDASTATQDCLVDPLVDAQKGCSLLGGGITLGVSSANTGATIVDTTCTIDPDPRWRSSDGYCDKTALIVENYCPGFGPTVIPGYLCGASGPSGHGFALIKSLEQNGFSTAPTNLLVKQELSADALLGGPGSPACPQLTAGWAPLTGEGTIPEGNEMIELASYCGTTRILAPGHSLIGVGLQLQPNFFAGATPEDQLVTFATQKLDNLTTTINKTDSSNAFLIVDPARTTLASCVATVKTYLTNNNGTGTLVNRADRYACAAHQAWTCDQSVSANNFRSNTDQLSLYSEVRGRLANLITHISNRIANPTPNQPRVWPLPEPGAPAFSCDDNVPPTAPGNLRATSTGTSVTLNWTAATDNKGVSGYDVWRDAGSGFTKIASAAAGTSYTDSTVAPYPSQTTYSYYVVAVDTAVPPNRSDPSNTVSGVKTADNVPPTAFSITNVASTATTVTLTWTASTDPPNSGVSGYDVWRSAGSGFSKVAPGVTGTSFTDNTVAPYPSSTAYSYYIVAFDAAGNTTQSNTVTGIKVIDNLPPFPPTGLKATNVRSTTLTLSWTASTGDQSPGAGVAGYRVYRGGTLIGTVTSTAVAPTIVTFNDTGLTQSTTYFYGVAAIDKVTPTPNQSSQATLSVKTCYDPDNDNDCHTGD